MRFSWTVKRLERRRTLGQSNGVVSSVAPPGGGSAGVERARRGRRKRARQQRATRLTRWHRARDGRHTDGARAARPAVTTRSDNPRQLGGGRAKPCRRVVLSGNTLPGRKPRRAHTHGVDRGKAPRATNTSCVTGSLLARVEGLEATRTPHPLILSVPLGPSENPPQTPSKDPRETLLRHPQRTLGKPSSNTLKGPSENPPLRANGAHNPKDGRSFEYRLE